MLLSLINAAKVLVNPNNYNKKNKECRNNKGNRAISLYRGRKGVRLRLSHCFLFCIVIKLLVFLFNITPYTNNMSDDGGDNEYNEPYEEFADEPFADEEVEENHQVIGMHITKR